MGAEPTRPFTVAKLAEHWEVSETFVYDQIKAGRLRAIRLGGKLLRIKPDAVEDFECQHTESASSDASATMEPHTGPSPSGGLTIEERTAFRLARQTEPQRKPRLVSSGQSAR